MTRMRRGFTLVELIVVVAILVLLLALLLPAVQRVREAANLMECKSHLRSIGQAVALMTKSGKEAFPTGGGDVFAPNTALTQRMPRTFTSSGLPPTRGNQDWGWAYQILPYLESEALWNLQRTRQPAISVSAFRDDVGDAEVARTPIPAYFCPTRRAPQTVAGPFGERATIDYAGNAAMGGPPVRPGLGLIPFVIADINGTPVTILSNDIAMVGTLVKARRHLSPSQVAFTDRPLRMSDMTNGASNTVLIAEKRVNAERIGSRAADNASQPGDQFGFVSGYGPDTIRSIFWPPMADYPREQTVMGAPATPDGHYWDDATRDKTGQLAIPDGFGSSHLRGFNVLFVDGSVRHFRFWSPSGDNDAYQRYQGMMFAVCCRWSGAAVEWSVLED